MTAARTRARLERLAVALGTRRCTTCYAHPVREIFEDPESGHAWYDSMPEDRCPACDRPVARVYVLVISEDAESRAALLP
jgi:rubrerythrin